MTALLRCVARICCDADDDDDDNEFLRRNHPRNLVLESPAPSAVESTHMSRSAGGSSSHIYQPIIMESRSLDEQPQEENDDEEDARDDECCFHGKASTPQNDHGLHEFFRKLRERWRRYDSMETFRPATPVKENLKAGLSPLRTASSYDGSQDIPTIHLDEVVLPGSKLQHEMARAVSLKLEDHGDECVICMEGFDPTNPRMPTLCGCGQNKTYFHLPCLYQWIEQCEECPSCRQKLRWEEF